MPRVIRHGIVLAGWRLDGGPALPALALASGPGGITVRIGGREHQAGAAAVLAPWHGWLAREVADLDARHWVMAVALDTARRRLREWERRPAVPPLEQASGRTR